MEVKQLDVFKNWFKSVKDLRAKAAIQIRIDRFELGLPGDVKPVGEGVSEARIFIGKGYRLYFITRNDEVIILLCGGIKSSKKAQQADIEQAKSLAREIKT